MQGAANKETAVFVVLPAFAPFRALGEVWQESPSVPTLPAAGILGLGLLACAFALAGAAVLRQRRSIKPPRRDVQDPPDPKDQSEQDKK